MDQFVLMAADETEHPLKTGMHDKGWTRGYMPGSGGARPRHVFCGWSHDTNVRVALLKLIFISATIVGSAVACIERVVSAEDPVIFHDQFEVPPPSGPLNDTGIDWCADGNNIFLDCPVDSHPNQDGDFGRDALAREGELSKVGDGVAGFDFTKLDANGNDLPASASQWACVRDNHTELVWEVKVDEPGHLRYKDHTYTWYNPDSATNGGASGVQDGGECAGSSCDTQGFVQAVNSQSLCGASDWRMPTLLELQTLTHMGRRDPAIDTEFFPNTPSELFWSASPYGPNEDWALSILFSSGSSALAGKSAVRHVRLVRDRQ